MNPGKALATVIAALMLSMIIVPLLPGASAAVASEGFTVTYHFSYASETGEEMLPCQGAYVQLWQHTTQENVIAYGYTDDEGNITFPLSSSGIYYAIIHSTDAKIVKVLNDSAGDEPPAFQWSSAQRSISSYSVLDLNITSDDRGAWNAYDAIRMGAAWLKEEVNWWRTIVAVNWPSGDWSHSHGDSIDIPAATTTDNAIWDTKTLLHEYGHCVMWAARGNNFPDVALVDPHYMDSESSGSFAFVEGWAEFFACAVLNDPQCGGFTNLESTTYADSVFGHGSVGDKDGNKVEGAVANVLWDIYDGVDANDKPYWAEDTLGDQVNNSFSTFWIIFITEKPDDMMQVWSAWENKDEALLAIFAHARFDVDLSLPTNPNWFWSDHDVGVESNDASVTIGWTGAVDNDTGIAGYSILWTTDPNAVPDTTIDTYGSYITHHLEAGTWYLKVRAIDNSGNAAENATTFGPFVIAVGAVDIDPNGNSSNGEMDLLLQIVLLVVLAAAALLLVVIVSRVVRKPTKEDVAPAPPIMQYYAPPVYYQYQYPPVYYQYPPQYQQPYQPPVQQPNQPAQQDQIPQVRFCRNCGRSEIGDTYCPYCGYKLR